MKQFASSTMEYRGYRALISYDEESDMFIGEVLGINDSLNFYGNSTKELKDSFYQSINNYLEICRKTGKKPEREYKGTFNIRIPTELHKRLFEEAESKHITLNQHIKNILQNRDSQKIFMENKILLRLTSFLLRKTRDKYCEKFRNDCLKCSFGYGLDECRNCILNEAYWSVIKAEKER